MGTFDVVRQKLQLYEAALKKIAEDDGTWLDGNGIRDGGPKFTEVQSIAVQALKDAEELS